jgi:2,4-dienoyl-CoA reductase-like NADH-dependent reductase (Old Yellow Enzyme family)
VAKLFEALKIRNTEFSNRAWVSPMCQYSATDGFIGDWHFMHLGALVSGRPGLVMVEATGIVPEGRITIGCPSIEDLPHAIQFQRIIEFAHENEVKIGIQISHAGRKGSTMRPWDSYKVAQPVDGGWQTSSASTIPFDGLPTPKELTISEIASLVSNFADAASRAVQVGFDVIEIHAAHGYLLHQFYSPLTNKRTDSYGGNFEGRIKFLLETAKAVRDKIGEEIPLFVRISATDWVENGWKIEDSITLCRYLKELGVDLIDVSSGGNIHNAKIGTGPGYQVEFSRLIKKEVEILTSAVGGITQSEQAELILLNKEADAVFLAREMLRNPRWPLKAAFELNEQVAWPSQLMRGMNQ